MNAHGESPLELESILTRRGYQRAFLTEKGIESSPLDGFFCRRLDAVDLPPRTPARHLTDLLERHLSE
jgi:hypothetical protein